ncbi:MAG: hypothetical protein LBV49_04455, partial [Azonexus sp.]|nr:hypothetical protein [Azonexus sp.]
MQIISRAALALILTMPPGALAASSATDVEALRKEIQLLRADYEARLQALEQRVKAAEAVAAQTAAAPPAPAPAPEPAPAPAPAPASVAPAGGGVNAFNPALSLILSGSYTRAAQNPAKYAISGFPLPPDGEIGLGSRGFSLAESELGIAANIDPWLRGVANISLKPDDSVSVEEAFIHTTALGNGLSLKAGRFFSNVGYLNPQHSHTWDFADNPLAYQALLGTQYGDDGV